jgi:hypothetical protein
MRWTGHVALMGEMRNAYKIFVGKHEGKRHRWEDDIRMDLREKWWDVVDWTHIARDRVKWRAVVNTVMILWVPQKVGDSWLTEKLSASQEGLYSVQLFRYFNFVSDEMDGECSTHGRDKKCLQNFGWKA